MNWTQFSILANPTFTMFAPQKRDSKYSDWEPCREYKDRDSELYFPYSCNRVEVYFNTEHEAKMYILNQVDEEIRYALGLCLRRFNERKREERREGYP